MSTTQDLRPAATGQTARARPPKPTFFDFKPDRPGGALRTFVKRAILRTLDSGLAGVPRLDTHVVICGFPRSGSTLLQLIVESCYQGVRSYREEKSGVNAARELRRTHSLMITKKPSDLFLVDDIRAFYRGLHAQPRFVLTTRDPRAVLTSRYSGRALANTTRGPDGYVMSSEVWREWFTHFEYVSQGLDTLVVEFADLVKDPLSVQEHLSTFIGRAPDVPFDKFLDAVPEGFETKALNGVRSFDTSSLDRWREPKYRERIQQLLHEMPELPALLVRLGYEADAEWTREYA
ncbi:MAG: sulfotransferase domain-containing protein [Vicinamibacterales bacterium]